MQDEIQDLLYKAAVTQAVAHGFRLGAGANNLIMDAATNGAIDISGISGVEERDAKIEQGVRAFRIWVDTMIGKRREAYRNDSALLQGNIIGEKTFDLTRLELCPGFWPFC